MKSDFWGWGLSVWPLSLFADRPAQETGKLAVHFGWKFGRLASKPGPPVASARARDASVQDGNGDNDRTGENEKGDFGKRGCENQALLDGGAPKRNETAEIPMGRDLKPQVTHPLLPQRPLR